MTTQVPRPAARPLRPAAPLLTVARLGQVWIEDRYRAAGGVVIDEDRVLVLRRESRDEWRLPKGHVEPGEQDLQAAFREVAEESGYDDLGMVADLGLRLVEFDVFPGDGPGRHVAREEHYFLMAAQSLRTRRRDPAELKFDPRWLPVGEAQRRLTYESEREWLRAALAASGNAQNEPVNRP